MIQLVCIVQHSSQCNIAVSCERRQRVHIDRTRSFRALIDVDPLATRHRQRQRQRGAMIAGCHTLQCEHEQIGACEGAAAGVIGVS